MPSNGQVAFFFTQLQVQVENFGVVCRYDFGHIGGGSIAHLYQVPVKDFAKWIFWSKVLFNKPKELGTNVGFNIG